MPPRTQRESLASERRRCVLRVRSSREDFELGTNFPNSKASARQRWRSKLRQRHTRSLNLYFGACVFQLLLRRFRVGLVHAFLDGLRRTVDEILGFLQAEARQLTHCLDHVDLICTELS